MKRISVSIIVGILTMACGLISTFAPPTSTPQPTSTATAIPPSPTSTPEPNDITFPEVSDMKISENPQGVVLLKWIGKGNLKHDEVFYSSDQQLIAVSSNVGLYLFDSMTLNEIGLIDRGNNIDIVAFSPDGTHLISSSHGNNVIKLWDSRTREKVLEKDLGGKVPSGFQHNGVYDIVYTPNEKFVIIRSKNGIYILNSENFEIIHFLDVINGGRWVAVSPDSQIFASPDNSTIVLWDIQSGEQLSTTMSYEKMEEEGWISNSHLLSNTPIKSLDELHLNENIVNNITKVTPDGYIGGRNIDFNNQRVAVYNNGSIEIWGFGNGDLQLIRMLDDIQQKDFSEMAFLSYGTKFVVNYDDGTFQIWDTSSWQSVYNKDIVVAGYSAFSPVVQQLASLTVEPESVTMELWDINTGQSIKNKFRSSSSGLFPSANADPSLFPPNYDSAVLKYSSDGEQLAVGNVESDHIMILDTATGKKLSSLDAGGSINQIMYFQNGQILARVEVWLGDLAGTRQKWFRLWDASSGQLIRENEGSEEYVRAYSISPDGKQLASSSRAASASEALVDGAIELINIETGDVQYTLEQPGDVRYIEYLLDGRLLVSISYDGIIRFWGIP